MQEREGRIAGEISSCGGMYIIYKCRGWPLTGVGQFIWEGRAYEQRCWLVNVGAVCASSFLILSTKYEDRQEVV